ncbi:TPA: antirestriction protein [Escherichia coli]|uniref:antirestriction protein n=1 Tax=Escherichia coli TaxID=562 RepID=UPI000C7C41EF|nr:antirestriction protein [Escherichia coli]EFH8085317.1 antirestriction protein [Escherichia coli]EHB0527543.1 antirestriction protein [Escherichia coli]ELV1748861.1 antirestriction protein [Escherichia coli]PLA89629.1 restriction endonuclease [Escherichia coli]SQZ74080.1 CP4-57 prophage; putative antirestriction protein [Escherichia coli]
MNTFALFEPDDAGNAPAESRTVPAIQVTEVPDDQRVVFWPQHFGTIPQWITLEPHIFAWMERFCADYHGGIWVFFTLSNGGAFMVPEAGEDGDETPWQLFNPMNGNGADMSAEAAGIAVCLIAYSHHACRTECDTMTEHYYRLRDYALRHPECHAIMRIID